MLFILVIVALFFISRNITAFGNIIVVLLGFGGVVVIHEFGHFIVAKLSDIKVEAFSIFMPPTLIGIKKTAKGFRFRILPKFFPKEDADENAEHDEEQDGLIFTLGSAVKDGETEYRIGLIPLGGFVKMLGQEDAGPIKSTTDPRSFANKPTSKKMAVISAGVVFNAISAIAAFVVIFLVGIKLPPPVIGWVVPDSPAAKAGLQAGDEIVEIDGKTKDLDFSNILVAAALSGKDEQISLKVKRDDQILDFTMASVQEEGADMRMFGVEKPMTLEIANIADDNDIKKLNEMTGLLPGDLVTAIDGKAVRKHWELRKILHNTFTPQVTLQGQRKTDSDQTDIVRSLIDLEWGPTPLRAILKEEISDTDLNNIYTIIPRLRVATVSKDHASKVQDSTTIIKKGDIILAIANIEYPTFDELRDATRSYENKKMPINVSRTNDKGIEEIFTVIVTPKTGKGSDHPTIGIYPMLDAEHPVVAKTINTKNREALPIPRGAAIEAVDGTPVANYYDIIREIRKNPGQRITLDYRLNAEDAGDVVLNVGPADEPVGVIPSFSQMVPFDDLKKLYKATGPIDAVVKGYRKTVMFIAQTYVTLRRVIGGLVSPKNLMGPVGILKVSYIIVTDQPLVNYLYLLALISACIAVVNFMPIPPFDGGLIVILAIEKIKGSALSERIQGVIAYAGVALVLALFLYLTINDVLNWFIN
jgi:regulator of sigma E protease